MGVIPVLDSMFSSPYGQNIASGSIISVNGQLAQVAVDDEIKESATTLLIGMRFYF